MPVLIFLSFLSIWVLCVIGYVAHIAVVCGFLFGEAVMTMNQVVITFAGTFVPPIGIVHGWGAIFGAW